MCFHLATKLELFTTLKYLNQPVTMLYGFYSGFLSFLCESLSFLVTLSYFSMREMKLIGIVMLEVFLEINWWH